MNDTLFKLYIIDEFLKKTQEHRKILIQELIDGACDPVIKKRRFRMLRNLSEYESSVIKKIADFETDDIRDLLCPDIFDFEIEFLLDRSA